MKNTTEFIVKNKNTGTIQGIILAEEILNTEIKKDKNDLNVFTFSITRKENNILDKTNLINKDNIIQLKETGDLYFISKFTKTRSNGIISFAVECEAYSYKLNNYFLTENYSFTGTITQLMDSLPIGAAGFTYTTSGTEPEITIEYTNAESWKKAIQDAVELSNYQLKYVNGNAMFIEPFVGRDNNVLITIAKNLNNLEVEEDQDGNIFYRIDMLELLNSAEYNNAEFKFLEEIDLWDKVIVQDVEFGINQKLQIIEYNYNPCYIKNSTLTLGNNLIKTYITEGITKDNLIEEINNAEEKIAQEAISGGGNFTAAASKKLIDNQDTNPQPYYAQINNKSFGFYFGNGQKHTYFNLNQADFTSKIAYNINETTGSEAWIINKDGTIIISTHYGLIKLDFATQNIILQNTVGLGKIEINAAGDILLSTPNGDVIVNGTPL